MMMNSTDSFGCGLLTGAAISMVAAGFIISHVCLGPPRVPQQVVTFTSKNISAQVHSSLRAAVKGATVKATAAQLHTDTVVAAAIKDLRHDDQTSQCQLPPGVGHRYLSALRELRSNP